MRKIWLLLVLPFFVQSSVQASVFEEPSFDDPNGTVTATVEEREESSQKSFGLRWNVLPTVGAAAALQMGLLSVEGDIPVGRGGFVVGPMLAYGFPKVMNQAPVKVSTWAIGARASYFFAGRPFTDSWYLSGYYNSMHASAKLTDPRVPNVTVTGTQAASALGGLVGYHWFWKSGFNLSTGLGAARYQGGTTTAKIKYTDERGTVYLGGESDDLLDKSIILPSLELTMGWVF